MDPVQKTAPLPIGAVCSGSILFVYEASKILVDYNKKHTFCDYAL